MAFNRTTVIGSTVLQKNFPPTSHQSSQEEPLSDFASAISSTISSGQGSPFGGPLKPAAVDSGTQELETGISNFSQPGTAASDACCDVDSKENLQPATSQNAPHIHKNRATSRRPKTMEPQRTKHADVLSEQMKSLLSPLARGTRFSTGDEKKLACADAVGSSPATHALADIQGKRKGASHSEVLNTTLETRSRARQSVAAIESCNCYSIVKLLAIRSRQQRKLSRNAGRREKSSGKGKNHPKPLISIVSDPLRYREPAVVDVYCDQDVGFKPFYFPYHQMNVMDSRCHPTKRYHPNGQSRADRNPFRLLSGAPLYHRPAHLMPNPSTNPFMGVFLTQPSTYPSDDGVVIHREQPCHHPLSPENYYAVGSPGGSHPRQQPYGPTPARRIPPPLYSSELDFTFRGRSPKLHFGPRFSPDGSPAGDSKAGQKRGGNKAINEHQWVPYLNDRMVGGKSGNDKSISFILPQTDGRAGWPASSRTEGSCSHPRNDRATSLSPSHLRRGQAQIDWGSGSSGSGLLAKQKAKRRQSNPPIGKTFRKNQKVQEIDKVEEASNDWDRRAVYRQRQIGITKSGVDYQTYAARVPKESRGPTDPQTPRISERISKRAFDSVVQSWRIQLHTLEDGPNGRKFGAEETIRVDFSPDQLKAVAALLSNADMTAVPATLVNAWKQVV